MTSSSSTARADRLGEPVQPLEVEVPFGQGGVGPEGQQQEDAEAARSSQAVSCMASRLLTLMRPRVTARAGTFSEPAPESRERRSTPPSRAAMMQEMTSAPMTSAAKRGGVGRQPGRGPVPGRLRRQREEDRDRDRGLGQDQREVDRDLQRRGPAVARSSRPPSRAAGPPMSASGAAKKRPRTSGISLSEMVWVSRRAWTLSTNTSVAAKASATAHHGRSTCDRYGRAARPSGGASHAASASSADDQGR